MLLVRSVFLDSEKHFFPFVRYSWLWIQFFRQVEPYFLTNSSFRLVDTDSLSSGKSFFQSFVEAFEIWRWHFLLVETDFLASKNCFSHFSDAPSESYFLSSGNAFLNESSNLYRWGRIFCPAKTVFFYLIFFSTSKNRDWN